MNADFLDSLKWNENGLIPAIAQDSSGRVLMLAYMNRESFLETLKTGFAVYFSRSRQKLWQKGEESGHRQKILKIQTDCDQDTILLTVEQQGLACHTGRKSCFFYDFNNGQWIENAPVEKDMSAVYGSD